MSTGIFHIAGSSGRRRVKQRIEPLDRFAELLSEHDLDTGNEGGSVTLTCGRMGVTTAQGYHMFNRIKAGLGWQAQ